MSEQVVADSTILIGLERIQRLGLLPALFGTVLIPPEVEREFGISYDWLSVEVPTNPTAIETLKLVVDDGEAEAIGLAVERQLRIILDDRQALPLAIAGGDQDRDLSEQAGGLVEVGGGGIVAE